MSEALRIGPYELSARIAKGGMAEIWVAANHGRRARDAERVCVVKKLLPQFVGNEEHIQMFLEEGRLATAFDHPNVVKTFDFGTDNEPFLAMEYLHGEDLRTVLRQLKRDGKTVPLPHAITIMRRVAAGLHHAHEARSKNGEPLQVIHRDVSPHNVLLTFDGEVKVVDFGIAKSRERRWETKHGTLKGKVPYMSPEQIKARKLDRRTDIYAAGVMLYELVLGKRPYVLTATGDFAQMMAIARHDVVSPAEVDPTLDPMLQRIILNAMAYDPKDRYPTFAAMLAELDVFARIAGIDGSNAALSEFMSSLFGARVDAWRAAITDEDALTHVIALEEARALIDDPDDEEEDDVGDGTGSSSVLPLPPASAALVVSSAAIAAIVDVNGVTVVTLRGKIDESFDGAALGKGLRGTVLLDLEGVDRITSFGVREWIEMTKAIAESTAPIELWLARCSEPIVTQMAHIRSFPGTARLLSFHAPFLCNACGNAWMTTLDCERDATWLSGSARDPVHAVVACPRCGGAARLDDDPAFLSFAEPHAGTKVPPNVRQVLATIEQTGRGHKEWIEKVVSDQETRVRILRDVDPQARWPRLLAGVEGRLVVEFKNAPRVPGPAAAAFVRSLRGLDREVDAIEIVEAPLPIAEALRSSGDRRISVTSVLVEARCAGCGAMRSGLARPSDLFDAIDEGRVPFVACRRCDGPLDLTAMVPRHGLPPASLPAQPLPSELVAASSGPPWLALGLAAAAFVILVVAIAMKLHSP